MANVEDTVKKEYIDKHEAYLLLKHKAETYMLPATKEAYEKAAILIDSMKTHDVQPVKQGLWLDNPTHSQLYSYICSNCRNSCDWTYRYCPNCGCKQDLGGT
jgi:hypothetical protein